MNSAIHILKRTILRHLAAPLEVYLGSVENHWYIQCHCTAQSCRDKYMLICTKRLAYT